MSAAKVKYAIIGAGSGLIYNVTPFGGAEGFGLTPNQRVLQDGKVRLYDTVEEAINDILAVPSLHLVVARVTITETPATLRVLDAGEPIEPGDKFVLGEDGLFLKIETGFFRTTSLVNEATRFDTAADAALLRDTADMFLGHTEMFPLAVREVPGDTTYTVEPLS